MIRHCLYLLAALAVVGGVAYLLWPEPPAAAQQPRRLLMHLEARPQSTEAPAPARPRVMLLGTGPAFAPRTADGAKQVAAVVEGLEPFRPTRVLVERPAADRPGDLDAAYRAFADGRATDSPERLIGFALARRLGHDRVYGFGGPADDEPAGLRPGAKTAARARRVVLDRSLGTADAGAPGLALRDHLLNANEPEVVRKRYAAELVTAAAGDPTGWLTGEHRRRLRMFAAVRAATAAGERVLAVVGAGPLGVLRLCAEGCPDLELVEVGPYLGAVPRAVKAVAVKEAAI